MKTRTYSLFLFFQVVFLLDIQAKTIQTVDTLADNSKKISATSQASQKETPTFQELKGSAQSFKKKRDTLNYLRTMIKLSDLEKRNGKFDQAFNLLWEILPTSGVIENKVPSINIHQKLGVLFRIFRMDSMSLAYKTKALRIGKEYLVSKDYKWRGLASCYFGLANEYKMMHKYKKALTYLDSCILVSPPARRRHYIDAVYGQIYLRQGKLEKAQKHLDNITSFFEKKGSPYQSLVYCYQGELKYAMNQTDSAIYFYEKSLYAIDSFQVNHRVKPKILDDLGHLYAEKKNYAKAFAYMQEAKSMADSLVRNQGAYNSQLFEINDKYKRDLSEKTELLLAQEKMLELKDKASLRLKLLIGILVLLTAIGLVTLRLRSRIKRIMYEQSVEKEKNEAILEVKNKELATSALQIIEKENIIKELLNSIKEIQPDRHKKMYSKYKQSNQKLWDDFHLRFSKINNKFYDRLLELHPGLTPTDLKHCALIKLNFDSKEMSQILGISLHSVHVSRSRIRKKLNLAREENLSNYITTL